MGIRRHKASGHLRGFTELVESAVEVQEWSAGTAPAGVANPHDFADDHAMIPTVIDIGDAAVQMMVR